MVLEQTAAYAQLILVVAAVLAAAVLSARFILRRAALRWAKAAVSGSNRPLIAVLRHLHEMVTFLVMDYPRLAPRDVRQAAVAAWQARVSADFLRLIDDLEAHWETLSPDLQEAGLTGEPMRYKALAYFAAAAQAGVRNPLRESTMGSPDFFERLFARPKDLARVLKFGDVALESAAAVLGAVFSGPAPAVGATLGRHGVIEFKKVTEIALEGSGRR